MKKTHSAISVSSQFSEAKQLLQQQLELAEKKRVVKAEIQKFEVINSSLQLALDTVRELETIQRNSLRSLTDQLAHFEELKNDLDEQYRLLEQQEAEAIAETALQTRLAR